MELEYITQLTDEEIIELINQCIKMKNTTQDNKEMEIDSINVLKEPDRRDDEGCRYIRVHTAAREGILHLHCYRLTDFTMRTNDLGFKNINYDEEFKTFMAKRFGEFYLKDLYDLRIQEACYEVEKISELAFGSRNQ